MSLRHAALACATIALVATGFVSTANAADAEPSSTATASAEHKPIIKRFGTWSTRCDEDAKTKKISACHAFIDVRAGEDKRQILYLGVGRSPKNPNQYFAFTITPLGSILPPGVGVSIDDTEKFGGPFAYCIPMGCQAEIKLEDKQLSAMKTGKQGEVLFRLLGQGVVKVPVKLDGFTAAIKSLPMPEKADAN